MFTLVQNIKKLHKVYLKDLNSLLMLVVDLTGTKLPPCAHVHFVEKTCCRLTGTILSACHSLLFPPGVRSTPLHEW